MSLNGNKILVHNLPFYKQYSSTSCTSLLLAQTLADKYP